MEKQEQQIINLPDTFAAGDSAGNEAVEKQNISGESYDYTDQELIRLLVKSRMDQKQTLEYEDLDGYEMPPRSQFSMLKKPAVSIKYGKMTFNMASIRLFEGVQHILPLYHPKKKRLTVVMCREEEYNSVEWARIRQKDGMWVNKDITSREYIDKLYRLMDWNKECRYKVLGRVANSRDGLVLVFDLEEAVMFESKSLQYVDMESGETKEKKQQVMYYPEFYRDRVGRSYNDYVAARQMNLFEYLDGYVGNTYSDYKEAAEKTEKKNDGDVVEPDAKTNLAGAEPDGAMMTFPDEQKLDGKITISEEDTSKRGVAVVAGDHINSVADGNEWTKPASSDGRIFDKDVFQYKLQ